MFAQQLFGQTDELAFVSDGLTFLEHEDNQDEQTKDQDEQTKDQGTKDHGTKDAHTANGPLSQPERIQSQAGNQLPPQPVRAQSRPHVPARQGRPAPVTTPIMPKRLPPPPRGEPIVGAQPNAVPPPLDSHVRNTEPISRLPQIPPPMQRMASFRPLPPVGPRTFYGPPAPPSLGLLGIDGAPQESLQKWPGDPDMMWVLQDGDVASSSPTASPEESYGAEPVDRSLQFLRGQAVLLSEGQWQFDYGLAYAVDSSHVPALDGGNIVRADIERRQFAMPLGVRYGWDNRTQVFANLPIGLAHTEFGTPFTDLNTNTFDIGDLNIGVSRLIQQGSYYCPDIIFTVDATMPLGDSTVPPDLTSADMSNGVWSAATSLLFVHQYDPMVVYWGGGFRYNFEATHGGISYDPGHEFNYQMGTGFAVNDRMTLGAAVIGSFVTEAEFNDVGVGGVRDSLRGRLSLTTWRNCRIVEPFVEWGMTEDAPDARLGVIWTR